jgi:hypothetical protein
LKKYKSLRSDQILAELIQAIHKLIYCIWNKEELPDQWKESIIVLIHKKGNVRQIEVHTAEQLVPGPICLENEIAIAKLKKYKVIKFYQNSFKQEVKHYYPRSANSLILLGIRKNFLISGRSLLLYQFTKRVWREVSMRRIPSPYR